MEKDFDQISLFIQFFVIATFLVPAFAWRDYWRHPAKLELIDDPISIVPAISQTGIPRDEIYQTFGDRGFMLLPRSQFYFQGFALHVHYRVNFG